jgi:hypothetical protein
MLFIISGTCILYCTTGSSRHMVPIRYNTKRGTQLDEAGNKNTRGTKYKYHE